MTTQNRIKTVLTLTIVAMAIVGLMAGAASAAITFDGFTSWAVGTSTYDASGSDKLVVVVTGEHNFNQSANGQIYDVTYDGQSLIKAVDVDPKKIADGGHGDTATDIWYLDDPGSFHTAGLIAASVSGSGNNYVYTAMGLSGTADGVGATAAAPGAFSVDLTTTAAGSMVISVIGMGGGGNTASPLPGVTANSPAGAVTIDGLEAGNNWAGHAVARTDISSPGLQTFSFDTTKTDVATIAAAFEDAFVDPTLPDVDAGNNWITWSGEAVTVDANVVNNDSNEPQGTLTYLWTADAASVADPNLDVVITDANQEDPNASVTITKTVPTGDATVVTITLAVTLPGKDPVEDTMTIDVYDNSCLAAEAVGPVEYDPTDIDGNCITNFGDFAVMAITWLVDYKLPAPEPK